MGMARMTANLKIERYNHDGGEFWRMAGPLFASAQVRRELGRPMTSSPMHVWWLAMIGGEVAGIAAIRRTKSYTELVHAYVLPVHRRKGIYTKLLRVRIAYAQPPLRATATAASQPALEKAGFVQIGSRGRYAVMELGILQDCSIARA